MAEDRTAPHPTLALSTKVEEDFVAPLTAVRGALEILRDFPELTDAERQRFLSTAIRGCARLEQAVTELGEAVYAAGQKAETPGPESARSDEYKGYAQRVTFLDDIDAVEIDFSDFVFSDSRIVNSFYDVIDELIAATGRKWYLIVNYRNCSIWPEAWVAFAHRGKKVNVNQSLGTVRYTAAEGSEGEDLKRAQDSGFDPDLFPSRDLALARLAELKREAAP